MKIIVCVPVPAVGSPWYLYCVQDPAVVLRHVRLMRHDQLVLDDVSFEVPRGQFLYLIGKTGSGKSSLLKMLHGEIRPEAGEAWIGGMPLHSLRRSQVPMLRRKLGMVFQDFQLLYDRTVGANLEFVMRATGTSYREHIRQRSHEVLDLVGLRDVLDKMPHTLSGGEQQRVVIARALVNRPEVILADEPTGHLDPETSLDIVRLLKNLCLIGVTVVMATHDMGVVERFPSRMLIFENRQVKDYLPPGVS